MSEEIHHFGDRIAAACSLSNMTLARACKVADINYNTTYNQISKGREIPASSIQRLSQALGIPLQFFFEDSTDPIRQSHAKDTRIARMVNSERAKISRAGFDVTSDDILDWFREERGVLRNWKWFEDQVDIYKPIATDDEIMHPVQFGENSITLERLMLRGKKDFYQTVGSMASSRLDRALSSHRALEHSRYVVTDEEIDDFIKGQRVLAGYRKITMRVTDEQGTPLTAVFSKLSWLRG